MLCIKLNLSVQNISFCAENIFQVWNKELNLSFKYEVLYEYDEIALS